LPEATEETTPETPVETPSSPALVETPEAAAVESASPAPSPESADLEEEDDIPPVEESPAPPVGPFSGLALWEAGRTSLIEQKPLFEMWLNAAHFISHEGDSLVIGFASEQRFFRESLSRYEGEMAEEFSKLAGGPIRLSVEVRDELEPLEMEEEEAEPSEPENSPESAQSEESVGPDPAGDVPAEEAAPEAGESFQDDPLIKEALSVFEARVIKS
jgi:hypothetical protein